MMTEPSKKMKVRLIIITATLFTVGFMILIGRILSIAVFETDPEGTKYAVRAQNQQLREVTVNPNRGTIYDRNMKPIAQSATVKTIFISPADIKPNAEKVGMETEEMRELIADGLSKILEVDKKEVLEKSKKANYYQEIKKKVEKDKENEVIEFIAENKITSIHLIEDSKRYYTESLAASVIGFTKVDGEGLYGIEKYYDNELSGTPGKMVSAKNAFGTDMSLKYEKHFEAKSGNNLLLTIDTNIQHFLEEAVTDVVRTHKAKNRACGVVMDVNTGEILAMASKPDFDLNNPFEIADKKVRDWVNSLPDGNKKGHRDFERDAAREYQWKNKVITELYEPGSVFKSITASAALEEKTASMNSSYGCSGVVEVGDRKMKCWRAGGHGSSNFTMAMVNSCNPAFVKIGQGLGPQKFFQYFKSFGFTEKTGIDLPGEATCIYKKEKDLGIVELASSSFGQTNKMTPMEMVTAFAATVNGGKLVTPHVVSKVMDEENNIIRNIEPQIKRQVVSEETSEKMRQIFESVVMGVDGTGSNAYVSGYRIGGKSGTSQKLDGDDKARVSSYCGFAPVEDPQVVVYIMVDEPSSNVTFGSVVSAPTFATVMADILPYLNIQRKFTEKELSKSEITVPPFKGADPIEAQNKLKTQGLNVILKGKGAHVVRQIPAAGTVVGKNSTIILYTDGNMRDEMGKVPDVTGKSLAVANQKLTDAGFNISIRGASSEGANIIVNKQSIKAGLSLAKGSVITITCVDNSETEH